MRFIRPRDVVEMIGVSRTTLWRMVQAGIFPRPVRITERNRGFLLEAVENWMKARVDGFPSGVGATALRRLRRPGRAASALLSGTAGGGAR